jgi:hypothetical protein
MERFLFYWESAVFIKKVIDKHKELDQNRSRGTKQDSLDLILHIVSYWDTTSC